MNRSYSWSKWIKERIRGYIDYSELFLDDNLEERVNKLKQKFVHDYYSEFSKEDKIWMADYGILPKDANKYAELDLKPEDLAMILSFNVPVDYVKIASKRFKPKEICSMYFHLVNKDIIQKLFESAYYDYTDLIRFKHHTDWLEMSKFDNFKEPKEQLNESKIYSKRFNLKKIEGIGPLESYFIPLRFNAKEYKKILENDYEIKLCEKLHPIFRDWFENIKTKDNLNLANLVMDVKNLDKDVQSVRLYKGLKYIPQIALRIPRLINNFIKRGRTSAEFSEINKRWKYEIHDFFLSYAEHLEYINYPNNLFLTECRRLYRKDITPERFNDVYKRWEKDIYLLKSYEEHLELEKYPEFININICKELRDNNKEVKLFDAYKKFNNEEKAKLILNDISYKEVLEYPDIFDANEIIWFNNDGKKGNDVKKLIEKYPGHNSKWYVYTFVKNKPKEYKYKYNKLKFSDDLDEEYEDRFGGYHQDLQEIELYPVLANKYAKRFSVDEVLSFGVNDINWMEANEYSPRFDFIDIIDLYKYGILGSLANMYPPKFKSQEIIILKHIGILPKEIDKEKLDQLEGLLQKIFTSRSINTDSNDYQLVGTGWDGLVLFRDDKAWKFSKNIEEEYKILKKINDYHKGEQKHIIKVLGEPIENMALQLEYIEGYSLDKVLKEERHVNSETILKWGYDILKGLKEMKDAGVEHHRDLRANNIMIDKDNNAMIIDFMRATEDKNAIQIMNSRYGSCTKLANDVNGLGQVLYAISSHKHIFANSISNTRTFSDIKEEIKDERTRAYNEGLDNYLIKIQINDKKLNEFITDCIKAEPDEFNKIYEKWI